MDSSPMHSVRARLLTAAALLASSAAAQGGATLEKRAVLPAASFSPGPTSGRQVTGPVNGVTTPFVDLQPVQGFSAVHDNRDGTFLVMSDNGFGSIENSSDYELRVYRIRPEFETASGGSGTIQVLDHITLSDPRRHVAFAITNHFVPGRKLTGADFDLESMMVAEDGTLWFGDEFGPFLLHADRQGRLLEAPIPLPDFDNPGRDLRSPQSPLAEEGSAIRIMNAVREHARCGCSDRVPVFSPWHVMLDDSNPNTFVDSREAPPAGSGLTAR